MPNSRDEEVKGKNFFSPNICQAKSGVISNLRDEEMKKISVKPGVISNSRDEEKHFQSKEMSSQI